MPIWIEVEDLLGYARSNAEFQLQLGQVTPGHVTASGLEDGIQRTPTVSWRPALDYERIEERHSSPVTAEFPAFKISVELHRIA